MDLYKDCFSFDEFELHTFDLFIVRMCYRIQIYRSTAGALTKQYHSLRISSKIGDVIVYPLYRSINIKKPKIHPSCRICKLRGVGLAEDIEPVIESNNCDVVMIPHEKLAVVSRKVALSFSNLAEKKMESDNQPTVPN